MTPAQQERFWSCVDRSDGCWTWTGAKSKGGYGRFKADGRQHAAHRVSYALANTPLPRNVFVCHRCDNPACVRPDHLFAGDHLANMQDMVSKGRSTKGRIPPSARLTERDVEVIRRLSALGVGQREIGLAFDVATSTIAHVVTGRTWANNASPRAA